MNTYDYFEQQLPGSSTMMDGDLAESLKELLLDSECGTNCKAAIDHCKKLIDLARSELEPYDLLQKIERGLIGAAVETCEIYYFG